jgi:DNA-binding LacI/PurR family transcriptional regulator
MTYTNSPAGPTLAVIAREARVSVPTVSKVVNGRGDVAPETRRRVTEVLDRLGYIRKPRTPSTGPHQTQVDLVLHHLDTSWSGAVLHGAQAAAQQAGLELVITAAPTPPTGTGSSNGHGQDWLHRLTARGSAGMLFNLAELTDPQYTWLEQHHIPFVMIDPVTDPPPHVATVGAANWHGGLTATQHLITLGHHRIAVIAGHPHHLCAAARIAGHRSALDTAGLPHHPEYHKTAHFDMTQAHQQTLELLDLPRPPTAIFACSDTMALGAYQAAADRGLHIPHDISIIGFDDLPEAHWAAPALTTIRQPRSDMAATALRLLVRIMAGDPPQSPHIELSTHLITRHSTAPPPERTRSSESTR